MSGHQHDVAAVDALLSLQEVPDATRRPSAGLNRARDMLDRLDEIRVGLLEGAIPSERLSQLVRTVRTSRDNLNDPRLSAILDEIELRAAVETRPVSLIAFPPRGPATGGCGGGPCRL